MWGITPPPAMVACCETGAECVRACRYKAGAGQVRRKRGACLDQGVQLLIAADGQLQVARGDTLHLRGTKGRRETSASRAAAPLLAAPAQRGGERVPSGPWRRCQPAPAPRPSGTLPWWQLGGSEQAVWSGWPRARRTEDGSGVHGGGGADTAARGRARLRVRGARASAFPCAFETLASGRPAWRSAGCAARPPPAPARGDACAPSGSGGCGRRGTAGRP